MEGLDLVRVTKDLLVGGSEDGGLLSDLELSLGLIDLPLGDLGWGEYILTSLGGVLLPSGT